MAGLKGHVWEQVLDHRKSNCMGGLPNSGLKDVASIEQPARKGWGEKYPIIIYLPPIITCWAEAPCQKDPPRSEGERTSWCGPRRSVFWGTEEEREGSGLPKTPVRVSGSLQVWQAMSCLLRFPKVCRLKRLVWQIYLLFLSTEKVALLKDNKDNYVIVSDFSLKMKYLC